MEFKAIIGLYLVFSCGAATPLEMCPFPFDSFTDSGQVFQSRRYNVFRNVGQMLLYSNRMQGFVVSQNFHIVWVILEVVLENKHNKINTNSE